MEPSTSAAPTTKRVLLTSFVVDLFGLVTNTIAAVFTGSVIMLVQAMEGFAGLCSVSLLLFGNKRANRQATKLHPFGYGKELYYWSTIAAFVIVSIVAVLALQFGYKHFEDGNVRHVWLALVALGLALVTNLYSFWTSFGKLLEDQPLKDTLKIFMNSPLIAPKNAVVLDTFGSLTALIGLLSLGLMLLTDNGAFDSIGAMTMGLALIFSAIMLLLSVRSLVLGQGAPKEMERKLRDAARDVPEVRHILGMRTLMIGSDKMLVNVEVHLRDGLNTDQVEVVVAKVKEAMEQTGEGEGLKVHVEPDAYEDVHRHGSS
jgi:cation diffusion facilitator family transporter